MLLHNALALAALATPSFAATVDRRAPPRDVAPCTEWATVTETTTVHAARTPGPQPQPHTPARSQDSADATYAGPPAKRGFAYNDAAIVDSLLESGTKGSWAYNWDSHNNGLDSTVEFVPMLWGDEDVHTSRWDANAREMLANGAKNLLSFNEPDIPEQANMTPDEAVAAHLKYMDPYGGEARLGSPATSNSAKPGQGVAWLEAFISACDAAGCQVDFCVAHWYAPTKDVQHLLDHLEAVRDACGGSRPVWLTEFAPEVGEAEAVEFIGDALETMDGLEWVERYSYYMVDTSLTAGGGGGLSGQGEAYFASN